MGAKEIQKLYETTVLTGRSKALEESRGGWMIGLLEDLENAFNSDAGFYNGKYQPTTEQQPALYVSKNDHKGLTKALQNLSSAMKKAYKGKLIGF